MTLSVVCLSTLSGVVNAKSDNLPNECIITELLSEKLESCEEKIPVYIWYKDINHSIIDQKVSKKLGFTTDDIENDYGMPNLELINELNRAANGDPQKNLGKLMDNHLRMTEESRREEKKKTDKYIDLLYNELNIEYERKTKAVIHDNNISKDDILFFSKFSPLIIAKLSSADIYSISKDANIETLDYFEDIDFTPCAIDFENCMEEMGIEDICDEIGLSGDGVKLGIYDDGNVSTTQDSYAINDNLDTTKVSVVGNPDGTGGHATYVASVAAARDGVAPDADIISASATVTTPNNGSEFYQYNTYNSLYNLEALIDAHADIITCCLGGNSYRGSGYYDYYTSFEKYIDDIISSSKVLIVKSAGNYIEAPISAFGLAFNTITVNSFSGDNISAFSFDHGIGCYKPDVIAPTFDAGGTSTSAPVITGMIALLYQYKPNLKLHPEVVKAILIGSVHEKKQYYYDQNHQLHSTNESLSSGLTDMQGAGVPNIYRMVCMVAQHSYGYGTFNTTTGYSRNIPIYQPKYGSSKINVSMAFIQTNVTASNPYTADDYDITLSNSSFAYDKFSSKSVSSTEMIYTNLSNTDNNYILNISKDSGSMSSVNFGYAWSTDSAKFYPTTNETGIYYIRNRKSGKYLTYTNNNSDLSLENFSGNSSQMWIIEDDDGLYDCLKTASGTDKNVIKGSLISGSYYKAIKSNNTSYLTLFNNSDGTYRFENYISNNYYNLGVFNNSTSSGVLASWYLASDTNDSQKWYIESVGYKCGDVNMDGSITSSDATAVLNMYSNISSGNGNYSNIEMYLADFNGNGYVDASDSSLILAYIS